MSTFNMTKKTSSTIKDVSLALILTGSLIGATLSTSVNATPVTSVENAVSNFVVAQGEKMITDLNTQLQQSINSEIKSFTAKFSLNNTTTWLAEKKEVKLAKPSENKENTHSLQLKSN
ncbi:hypothetical protein [Colwellia sp. 12G3]|uniref:hypothetical protein n=1 Tax=Colwellia sp. 12G3 TaxID=2058299 RepID=UPI000C34ED2F|nr:hypothetical protein [Colwellia sp. 12G3]PKI17740.1 hypothetical protein CXF71_02850 [Colwellia sp. 12G3]